jgi:hypothetical protein
MFSQKKIVAGILGTIATVGWTVQGVGNAFYYRQVSFRLWTTCRRLVDVSVRYGRTTQPPVIRWRRCVFSSSGLGLPVNSSTIGENRTRLPWCQSLLYKGLTFEILLKSIVPLFQYKAVHIFRRSLNFQTFLGGCLRFLPPASKVCILIMPPLSVDPLFFF